jgi:mannose-6-phosphate isomerase-like protein (cupin superfamily)
MKDELIEIYSHTGEGYNPFFIKDNWQVAQINYMPAQDLIGIEKMDKHLQTDEVFILIKGVSVLIAAKEQENGFAFHCISMQVGITYNIPLNVWHNIAMNKDSEIIIVEKNNTHLCDFVYQPLSEVEKCELKHKIQVALNQP